MILKRKGKPFTLRELRELVDNEPKQLTLEECLDVGGCACFIEEWEAIMNNFKDRKIDYTYKSLSRYPKDELIAMIWQHRDYIEKLENFGKKGKLFNIFKKNIEKEKNHNFLNENEVFWLFSLLR